MARHIPGLDHIVVKVGLGVSHTKDWHLLKNVYFRGDTALADVKQWADENGMVALVNGDEPGGDATRVHFITFVRKEARTHSGNS